ncbi:putative fluoride ion transporter CrcB 1 [Paenibacillus chitinolyticus]|uniref:fluoride efflux transporter CrcB n=1 Tax=Paenibacillus chitinolyticus TaxID=79263 RepID=UPI0026E4E992|nr:fluoride efflux transporter CrcB [Paenibacillus chitinolyticus]GKS12614.1 putative fluoride ion transporter CrcB 1 [Paenibacillus chitinolyticus]
MKSWIIGTAGVFGALSRYGLSVLWNEGTGSFPWGTLACNMIGCMLLGYFSEALLPRWPQELRTAVMTGFIGAFTTFSTFSMETVRMLQDHRVPLALLYIGVSLFGGLLAVSLGTAAAHRRKEKAT